MAIAPDCLTEGPRPSLCRRFLGFPHILGHARSDTPRSFLANTRQNLVRCDAVAHDERNIDDYYGDGDADHVPPVADRVFRQQRLLFELMDAGRVPQHAHRLGPGFRHFHPPGRSGVGLHSPCDIDIPRADWHRLWRPHDRARADLYVSGAVHERVEYRLGDLAAQDTLLSIVCLCSS